MNIPRNISGGGVGSREVQTERLPAVLSGWLEEVGRSRGAFGSIHSLADSGKEENPEAPQNPGGTAVRHGTCSTQLLQSWDSAAKSRADSEATRCHKGTICPFMPEQGGFQARSGKVCCGWPLPPIPSWNQTPGQAGTWQR